MTKTITAAIAASIAMVATPAIAQDNEILVRADVLEPSINNDTNKFWLDYKTDISEAERELASDLERATDAEDRREAYGEYFNELRDARSDYREEMNERGYRVVDFEEDDIQFGNQ